MGKARELLANAINTLIKERKTTHRKIVANGGPSNGPLGRLRNQEDDVGIDTLDRLALATGLEPWQLLHPTIGQDAQHSRLEQLSFAKLDAFEAQLVLLFRRLSDDHKHDVLTDLNKMAEQDGAAPSVANPFAGRPENRKQQQPFQEERRKQPHDYGNRGSGRT